MTPSGSSTGNRLGRRSRVQMAILRGGPRCSARIRPERARGGFGGHPRHVPRNRRRRARGRTDARRVRRRRRATVGRGNPGRPRPLDEPARRAPHPGYPARSDHGCEGPDRAAAGCAHGRRRLHRLPLLRRAGRHPGRAVRDREEVPPHRQAQGDRPHASGARDHRAQGHQGRPEDQGREAPGRPLHGHHPRPRVDRDRGRPARAAPLRRQLRDRRGHQAPREHPRAVVHARRQPGRLPVHLRHRAAVAQEPARQRRQRRDHERRRRRPEPQLRRQLAVRRRGLVVADRERDLPRNGAGLRARDEGAPGPDRPAEVQVPPHLSLVRPAAPLPVRVAGADAGGGRPPLCRVHGYRRQPGRAGIRSGRRSRSLHDQRHHGRLLVREDRRAQLDAGAERGVRGMRLRLPRRRGADPGGVREEPAVRPRPGALGAQSVAAEVPPRDLRAAVLPRDVESRSGEVEQPDVRLPVQRLVR